MIDTFNFYKKFLKAPAHTTILQQNRHSPKDLYIKSNSFFIDLHAFVKIGRYVFLFF